MDTTNERYTIFLEPYDPKRLASLCGYCGENLKLIESRLNVEIHSRGNYFEIISTQEDSKSKQACRILENLYMDTLLDDALTPNLVHLKILEHLDSVSSTQGAELSTAPSSTAPSKETTTPELGSSGESEHSPPPNPPMSESRSPMDKRNDNASQDNLDLAAQDDSPTLPSVSSMKSHGEISEIHTHRKVIRLRSANQKLYAKNIAQHDINFGIGPAGTGKTYLAVAAAVNAFKNDEVKRILLVRPAVEAGEKLGFLPGDLSEKVNPYLRPLYDALYEMLGFEQVAKLIDRQIIEVCPLAYMRGRTLSDAFIILDESQNTTPAQMKMLLTRIGFGSKAVITGDITQVDLPKGQISGLHHALQVLDNVDHIGVTRFATCDVVRHPLVKAIIEAYDKEESNNV